MYIHILYVKFLGNYIDSTFAFYSKWKRKSKIKMKRYVILKLQRNPLVVQMWNVAYLWQWFPKTSLCLKTMLLFFLMVWHAGFLSCTAQHHVLWFLSFFTVVVSHFYSIITGTLKLHFVATLIYSNVSSSSILISIWFTAQITYT